MICKSYSGINGNRSCSVCNFYKLGYGQKMTGTDMRGWGCMIGKIQESGFKKPVSEHIQDV